MSVDISDLYYSDIAEVGKIYKEVMEKWSRKANSHKNLSEMSKDV